MQSALNGGRPLFASPGTIQDVTASRSYSTYYQNTGSRPLLVNVRHVVAQGNLIDVSSFTSPTNPVTTRYGDTIAQVMHASAGASCYFSFWIVVPPGWYYVVGSNGSNASVIQYWYELVL